MTRISDDMMSADQNALTFTRFILASAVIWTHSYWRITGIEGQDDFSSWLSVPVSVIAVDGFFFLSGFLVYASLLRSSTLVKFGLKRLFRLWPALAVSVLMSIGVGMAITDVPLTEYFTGATAEFAGFNLSLVSASYYLTGIQCGDGPCIVNGSLWTIPWEVRCYVILAVLGFAGLSSPTIMRKFIIPASLAGAVLWHIPAVSELVRANLGDGLHYYINMFDRLWTIFVLGAALYIYREKVPISWWIWLGLLGTMIFSAFTVEIPHLASIFSAYTVLCLGFGRGPAKWFKGEWPDYSYGIYIYAFPVMMLIAAAYDFDSHAWLAALNLAAVIPLAALSWHFIEKPALAQLRHRSRPSVDRAKQA